MIRSGWSSVVSWCVIALTSGCGAVAGSGRVVDQQRTVGAWKTLRVESGIRAEVVKGEPGVVVTTDHNLLAEVEPVLEGTTLVVRVRPHVDVSSNFGIAAKVSGDVLESAEASGASVITGVATLTETFRLGASGASTLTITGLDATDVRMDASGASTITASGRATSLRANASGAPVLEAHDLPVRTAEVDGSGGSTLRLNVTDRLDGSLSGASHLQWTGGAASTVAASGGSTTTRSN